MRKWRLFAILIVVAVLLLAAGAGGTMTSPPAGTQTPAAVSLPERWLSGFDREISGEVIGYPSAYPGQTRALLTRATDGAMRIEWEAAAVPPQDPGEVVNFVWHAGLASGYGAHAFTLSVNGAPIATFRSGRDTADREWTVNGEQGARLSFKTTKVGTFNELFGLMVLTVPARLVTSRPARIAVVGEAAGSQDYYMTFARRVRDWARVVGEQAVLRGGRRAARIEVARVGDEADATLASGASTLWRGRIGPDYTALLVPVPDGARIPIALEIGGRRVFVDTLVLDDRVRRWEMHLLPHSHVDIGYSDPQPEVEKKQWKNLREAVALAAKTAGYPVDARFRWNVEGLWSVESYLRQAPTEERQAFVQAVRDGAIGLQANYTNILTGLASPEELAHWTDAARQLRARYGLPPIRSAMHTDIPGLSWPTVRELAQGGVRYFSSGPNYMPSLPDRGDRIGHTLNALGDRPFWWTSPSGNERLLFWMAGRGYSWFHGLNMGRAESAGRLPLLDYLRDLKDAGYPWDMVQVRYTIGGDNGPVDPALPDFVKSWNETFESPRLIINTAEAMFTEFERRYGAALPVKTGDMTPYWEDGALSSAGEEAVVRASARRLLQAETIWALRDPARFPAKDAAEAWRNVLLWHEHTWGAADSVNQPDRPDVVAQWQYKRQFAVEAGRQSRALLESAFPSATAEQTGGAAWFEVVNTLSWARTGPVLLDAGRTTGRNRASDAGGRPLPAQRLQDGRLAVIVGNVPAFGSSRIKVEAGVASEPASARATAVDNLLDNGAVRVAVDGATGVIRSLRAGEHEFAAGGGLNRYLYVPGRSPDQARDAGPARITIEEPGPVVARLRVESQAPGARSLVRRVTLVAGAPAVEIEDVLDKAAVRSKESAHLGFAIALPGAVPRVDEGGAVMLPDRNQIEGSCRDFIGAHSAVDVSNGERGITLVTLDAPLLEIGAMTDEQQDPKTRVRSWRKETAPGTTLYAYLLNNYWHTNYKADQEGALTFRFVLRPHRETGADALRRLSADYEQPLLARPVAARSPLVRPFFRLNGSGVIATSLRADDTRGALLLRLYNPSAREAVARLVASRQAASIRVDVLDGDGRPTRVPNGALRMRPFAAALVRIRSTAMPAAGGAARRP